MEGGGRNLSSINWNATSLLHTTSPEVLQAVPCLAVILAEIIS